MGIDFVADEDKKPGIDFEADPVQPQSLPSQTKIDVPSAASLEKALRPKISPLTTFLQHTTDLGGFQDELQGAGQAAMSIPEILKKKGISLDALSALRDKYRSGRDEARAAIDASDEQNPKAAITGDLGQAALIAYLTRGMGNELQGADKLSKWQKAQQAARVGSLYGLGHSRADLTTGDPEEYNKALGDVSSAGVTAGALANVPLRTLVGGGVGTYLAQDNLKKGEYGTAAAKIGGGALAMQVLPSALKRGFSLATGVNTGAIDDYLARSKTINASPTRAEMKDKLDTLTTSLRDKAEEAADTLDKAKGQKLNETADAVQGGLSSLKGKVVSGSEAATDVLRNAVDENGVPMPGAIRTRGLKQQLTNQIRRLMPLGPDSGAPPGGASQSVQKLQAWRDWVQGLPEYLTNEQAKAVIKRVDQASKEFYNAPAGSFAPEEQIALAKVRRGLDVKLKKNVPAYAEAMKPVSENAGLLNQATDAFPERSTIGKLQNLSSPQNQGAGEVLDQLGKVNGADYRGMLGTPAEEAAAKSAQAAADAVSPITPRASGQSGSEAFLKRMSAGKETPVTPSVDDQNLLETLKGHYPELPGQIQNLRTKEAFTGARTNGSRRTLMGTMLGSAADLFGGHVGVHTGGLGGPAGAAAGFASDIVGPSTGKAILDKAVIPIRDGASAVINRLSKTPAAQQFAAPLAEAAKDPADFATRFFMFSQQYPAFRGALEGDKNKK